MATTAKLIAAFALASIALSAAAPIDEGEYKALWTQFKIDFNKTYETLEVRGVPVTQL